MRAFLTGASGFIGGHTAGELAEHGFDVTAFSRRAVAERERVRAVAGDVTDPAAVRAAIAEARPDVVLHLAARLKTDDANWEYVTVNVQGTLHVLDACRERRTPVVYVSTMSVYDYAKPSYLPVDERHPIRPTGMYGETKHVGEVLCREYAAVTGAACVIVRLPGIYGPGRSGGLAFNLLQSAAREKPMTIGSLEIRRDFVYVRDAARALRLAATAAREGKSADVNLSGGSEPMSSWIAAAEKAVGRRPVYTTKAGGADADFYFDGRAAREALGFEPTSIDAAVADYWRHVEASER